MPYLCSKFKGYEKADPGTYPGNFYQLFSGSDTGIGKSPSQVGVSKTPSKTSKGAQAETRKTQTATQTEKTTPASSLKFNN
jgi:hypothetical protein